MKRPIQYFSKDYLEKCKKMKPEEIIEFLENYRLLVSATTEKCQPISLKIEPSLLNTFKQQAKFHRMPYQTLIKKLMKEWLLKN